MTLYDDLVAAGVPIDHHNSTLYFPSTRETRALVARHAARAIPFIDNIEGKPWLEVPFAYEPFWREREKR